jgi:hypothetical protein
VLTERSHECKGASAGDVSAKCEKADTKLNDLVVDHVRTGGKLPPPMKRP